MPQTVRFRPSLGPLETRVVLSDVMVQIGMHTAWIDTGPAEAEPIPIDVPEFPPLHDPAWAEPIDDRSFLEIVADQIDAAIEIMIDSHTPFMYLP